MYIDKSDSSVIKLKNDNGVTFLSGSSFSNWRNEDGQKISGKETIDSE